LTRGERALGIALGVLAGIAVVVAFVFLGSEDTVDAPSLSGSGQVATTTSPAPAPKPAKPRGVALVRVVSGAPPPSGPPKLEFKRGDRVRFKVRSDTAVGLEVMGLGRSLQVPAGRTVSFDFPARKTGLFAVLVSASHIAVATLQIRG
jgi:hypothetical protein